MNANFAFVRKPTKSYPQCISTHNLRHTINYSLARKQHENYCNTLKELNLEVIYIPEIKNHPDSCFIEDTAIIHDGKGLISRMGEPSRMGEEVSVAKVLANYLEIKRTSPPGTIEGGDIIHLPEGLICGCTKRTNENAILQLIEWLNVKVDICKDPEITHLKSYVTYLDNNFIICTEKYAHHPIFERFEKIILEQKEIYAANALMVNETVLMPNGFPNAVQSVKNAGFEVKTLETSEFALCDGALTCLSILI